MPLDLTVALTNDEPVFGKARNMNCLVNSIVVAVLMDFERTSQAKSLLILCSRNMENKTQDTNEDLGGRSLSRGNL